MPALPAPGCNCPGGHNYLAVVTTQRGDKSPHAILEGVDHSFLGGHEFLGAITTFFFLGGGGKYFSTPSGSGGGGRRRWPSPGCETGIVEARRPPRAGAQKKTTVRGRWPAANAAFRQVHDAQAMSSGLLTLITNMLP